MKLLQPPAVAYLILVRSMYRHIWIIVALMSLVVSRAVVGDPRLDHGILNATAGVIHLDVDSSVVRVSHFALSPGEAFIFDGVFRRLRVRLHTGAVLAVSASELRALHGGKVPRQGHWVVDSRGVHSVSLEDYMKAFDRLRGRKT